VIQRDYYQILGIHQTASEDEIKKAYRTLALKYHPDHHPGDSKSEESFKEISEAYAVLSVPDKRKEYDQFGHAGFKRRRTSQDIFRNFNFDDLFRDAGFGFEGRSFRGSFCAGKGMGCGRRKAGFSRRSFFWDSQMGLSEGEDAGEFHELQLTAEEARSGVEKQIMIESRGREKAYLVHIPRGIRPGTFRLVLDQSEESSILLRVRII
jgi:curved DNA-binding protein